MTELWQVHLSPWIIADGNYNDFFCGQLAEFALEFYQTELVPDNTSLSNSYKFENDKYAINAEVASRLSDAWVLDFGLMAFQYKEPPSDLKEKDRVRGSIELSIDPFFYFEQLSERKEMPALVYSWKIERITRRSIPRVAIRTGIFKKEFIYDNSKLEVQDVDCTNCYPPDFKYIHIDRALFPSHCISFILHCSKLDIPPKRTSATAT